MAKPPTNEREPTMPKVAQPIGALDLQRRLKKEWLKPGAYAVGTVAGLLLQVRDTGSRYWVLRTMVNGKRADIGVGGYPETSLAKALELARQFKADIKAGRDPRRERVTLADRKKETFSGVAHAYINDHRAGWKNAKHADQWRNTLETYAYPVIGDLHVSTITTAHVLAILKPEWATKTETMTRVRQRIELVLAGAQAMGLMAPGVNPAAWRGHLDQVLPKPGKVAKVAHRPAVPWPQAPAFIRQLRAMPGMAARCLEFVMLTAARSVEAREATWGEIDMEAAVWAVPAERMKAGRAHRVPLNTAALALLRSMPALAGQPYIFPGQAKGKPLSAEALEDVIERMGTLDATGRKCVPHGLRSTLSDWAAEATAFSRDVREQALAHKIADATEAAYRRGDLFAKRIELMQAWADFLHRAA